MKKFFICQTCGKIITQIDERAVPTMCCGSPMNEIIAGVTDASYEKHIPVLEIMGNKAKVLVGSVEHPMTPEHFIEWIVLETDKGSQIKYLKPETKPVCEFALLDNEKVISVYAYCNLHSLWKA